MPIVPSNKYRSQDNEHKVYNYVSGSDIDLVIPFDGLIDNLKISISVSGIASQCSILRDYNISPSSPRIPSSITSVLNGSLHGIIKITDKVSLESKTIEVEFHERR